MAVKLPKVQNSEIKRERKYWGIQYTEINVLCYITCKSRLVLIMLNRDHAAACYAIHSSRGGNPKNVIFIFCKS